MEKLRENIERRIPLLEEVSPYRVDGRVLQITGLVVEASGKHASIGDICDIAVGARKTIPSEVVGFRKDKMLLMPLGETTGIALGSYVLRRTQPLKVPVGNELLGRIVNGLGQPIDALGPLNTKRWRSISNDPPNPLARQPINKPLATGIRAIDGLVTFGRGQRVGIFAGSGVGKSVLLGMIARYTDADVNVIALIGERGREVREFIERDLGEEGLKRSVVVVATSDQAATVRIKGALVATTIAEYFRDQGKNVLLLMDSLTRVAMAQREIGLAIGEPPTTKGYTPSVFALMPRLLERAGNSSNGSITGLYTVLVEGDDMDDPIADTARSILDGHVVLSRKLAHAGHYPAIDVLASISRVRNQVISEEQRVFATQVLADLAVYRENEDLINIGAYASGSNPRLDNALKKIDAINQFLRQDIGEHSGFVDTLSRLRQLVEGGN